MKRPSLALAAAALWAAFFMPAAQAAPANQLPATGDIAACSGRPDVDVLCYGADPTDTADSGAAFANAWAAALAGGFPLHVPAGTYKIGSQLVLDASGLGTGGIRVVGDNATLDMNGAAAGPALMIQRSGGTASVPAVAQGVSITGLTVDCNLPGFCVQIGKSDFSDEFKDAQIDIAAVNASSAAGAGGVLIAYADAGDFTVTASALGSASGAALELDQVQRSRISGRLSAAGASAPSLLLARGASVNNVFAGLDYGASPVCLSITANSAANNLFLSPDLSQCAVPVSAAMINFGNTLVAPKMGAAATSPLSTGVAIVGRGGGMSRFVAPANATFTASGADDGTLVSSAAATGGAVGWAGASLGVNLPAAASVGAGWSLGLATDGGKALTVSGAAILYAGQSLNSLTLGPDDDEIAILQSDGTNYRLVSASPGTLAYNGLSLGHLTGRWIFPAGPGYQLTGFDNGETVSSGAAASSLAVTLPAVGTIPRGWIISLVADNKEMTISGGTIEQPDGSTVTSLDYPNYQTLTLQFDGAVYRVFDAKDPRARLHFASNAALAALWTQPGEEVIRDGVLSPGDGTVGTPPQAYVALSGACTLNGGLGDGGWQVPSANGCLQMLLHGPADPRQWGASGSAATLTGNCTSGSKVITGLKDPNTGLTSTGDFQIGQTVDLIGCGATPALSAPVLLSTSNIGTTGHSSYFYEVRALNGHSVSAASPEAAMLTGPAQRGTAFDLRANGPPPPGSAGVELDWSASAGPSFAVYEGPSGAETFIGITDARAFDDYGQVQERPFWIPNTASGAAQNDMLQAKITAIGAGTITLDTPAGATLSATTMLHDDTAAVQAAIAAAPSVYFECNSWYHLTASLIPAKNGQHLTGCGIQMATLAPSGTFNPIAPAQFTTGQGYSDFSVDASNMASGRVFDLSDVSVIDFRNIDMNNVCNGFQIDGSTNGVIHNVRFRAGGERRCDYDMWFLGEFGFQTGVWNIDHFYDNKAYQGYSLRFSGSVATINCNVCGLQLAPVQFETDNVFNIVNGSGNPVVPEILNFRALGLNFCWVQCAQLNEGIDIEFTDPYFQMAHGTGNCDVYIGPDVLRVTIKGREIFGGDKCGVDNWGFGTDILGTKIFNLGNTNNTGAAVIAEPGSIGTNITGGGSYNYIAGTDQTQDEYGIQAMGAANGKPAAEDVNVCGGWVGETADIDDETGIWGNVKVCGFPKGTNWLQLGGAGSQTLNVLAFRGGNASTFAVIQRNGPVNPFTDDFPVASGAMAAIPSALRQVGTSVAFAIKNETNQVETLASTDNNMAVTGTLSVQPRQWLYCSGHVTVVTPAAFAISCTASP